ncbi:hypothetical protein VTK73DRAFT_1205 [Phialemonium thermophilum]|uniref:Uncharacterized protein n=1 Tax=Phialemonium thermophilum TaxID=223376 RepID=A0ABR3VTS0_9PEZI
MYFAQTVVSLAAAALVAFSPTAQAFTTACLYQEYKCGYSMVADYGYNNTELIAAVNKTSIIPPLSTIQLLQVLYRCEDAVGGIAGNSYCIAGCVDMRGRPEDDQCAL